MHAPLKLLQEVSTGEAHGFPCFDALSPRGGVEIPSLAVLYRHSLRVGANGGYHASMDAEWHHTRGTVIIGTVAVRMVYSVDVDGPDGQSVGATVRTQ